MRVGLIARADNTGLGVQTWEFHRHMQPAKTLVVDISSRKGLASHPDRYPGARIVHGYPTPQQFTDFLAGLDVVFTCETAYGHHLYSLADSLGVTSVLQYNFEFLDHLSQRHLPRPTLFAAPSPWRYDDVPFPNKRLLPVPIPLDRFHGHPGPGATARRFLHVAGRPAIQHRNGTWDLLNALQHVQSEITVTITCQDPDYVPGLLREFTIPGTVTVESASGDVANYWDLYVGDVLVMPRRFGGLCLPVNEALGAGMPVIMTDIDPNNAWLPGEWLVPASKYGQLMVRTAIDLYMADPRALAARIDRFATDDAFFAAAKDSARALAKQYSWDQLQPEYEQTFAEAVQR